jgi:hypothetical protein
MWTVCDTSLAAQSLKKRTEPITQFLSSFFPPPTCWSQPASRRSYFLSCVPHSFPSPSLVPFPTPSLPWPCCAAKRYSRRHSRCLVISVGGILSPEVVGLLSATARCRRVRRLQQKRQQRDVMLYRRCVTVYGAGEGSVRRMDNLLTSNRGSIWKRERGRTSDWNTHWWQPTRLSGREIWSVQAYSYFRMHTKKIPRNFPSAAPSRIRKFHINCFKVYIHRRSTFVQACMHWLRPICFVSSDRPIRIVWRLLQTMAHCLALDLLVELTIMTNRFYCVLRTIISHHINIFSFNFWLQYSVNIIVFYMAGKCERRNFNDCWYGDILRIWGGLNGCYQEKQLNWWHK